MLLTPHCFHLYAGSGSLLNIQMPDAGIIAGRLLHLFIELVGNVSLLIFRVFQKGDLCAQER